MRVLLRFCLLLPLLLWPSWAAASATLDVLTLADARKNTAAINRAVVHQTIANTSSAIYKDFNPKSRKYISHFKNATLYLIDAEIDETLYRIKGKELITYTNTQPETTSLIYLRVYANNPTNVMRKDNVRFKTVEVDGTSAPYELMGTILEIELPKPLRRGESTNIYLEFSQLIPEIIPPPDTLYSFMNFSTEGVAGYADYGVYGYHRDIISLGHWFPMVTPFLDGEWSRYPIARNGDIQFFEPAIIKANIDIDKNTVAAASGIKTGEYPAENKHRKIESYLAFGFREMGLQLSKSFDIYQKKINGVTVKVFFSKNAPAFGQRMLDVGTKSLETFNTLISDYPYSELKIVESYLTNGAGGMEFPGLVTIAAMHHTLKMNMGPMAVLFGNDPEVLEKIFAPFLDEALETTIAHEVAHQWWNGVVGNDSVSGGWIDESLTNYFTLLYYEHNYGQDTFEKQKLYNLKLPVLFAKFSGVIDAPVNRPSSEYGDPLQYSVMLYSKGPYFYDNLRSLIGKESFIKASRIYFEKYKFTFAPDGGLTRIIESLNPSKKPQIKALYERWIEGAHLYEDVEGNYIAVIAEMAGTKLPESIDFEKGLLNSFTHILGPRRAEPDKNKTPQTPATTHQP